MGGETLSIGEFLDHLLVFLLLVSHPLSMMLFQSLVLVQLGWLQIAGIPSKTSVAVQ